MKPKTFLFSYPIDNLTECVDAENDAITELKFAGFDTSKVIRDNEIEIGETRFFILSRCDKSIVKLVSEVFDEYDVDYIIKTDREMCEEYDAVPDLELPPDSPSIDMTEGEREAMAEYLTLCGIGGE